MKTRIKPMVSWSIWAGGLSLVMAIVTREQLVKGFQSDSTGMSAVISAVFGAGLLISFLAARQLHSEWQVLKKIARTNDIPPSKREDDLAAMFGKLAEYKASGKAVDINTMIDTYHAKHNSRARSVSIMAALVISMGLLGTVVGLIMSISGLGGMVENIGLSRATMMEALKATVAGMGTAFYTTFFGALGGLILRAVAVSQLNSLSELCAEAAEYADAHLAARFDSKEDEINQKVAEVIKSFDHMRQEIENTTVRMTESFEETLCSFGQALAEAGSYALKATKESISGMTEQMAGFGDEIGIAVGHFNDCVEQSGEEMQESMVGMKHTLIEAGGDVADSFNGLNSAVKESTETVAGSLAEFKLSLDGTSIELNEAVSELHAAISEATGEIKTLAKARLDAEAYEIAGHLSTAADSIQKFLSHRSSVGEDNQKVA